MGLLGSSDKEEPMKTTSHTPEQIIKIIEQAEKGEQTIAAICREHRIAENTFYRWRKAYGGMSVSQAQRLKELEAVRRL
jgi:putative transposase